MPKLNPQAVRKSLREFAAQGRQQFQRSPMSSSMPSNNAHGRPRSASTSTLLHPPPGTSTSTSSVRQGRVSVDEVAADRRTPAQSPPEKPPPARTQSLDDRLHLPSSRPIREHHRNTGRVQGRRRHNYHPDGPPASHRQMRGESPSTRRRVKDTKYHSGYDSDDEPEYARSDSPPGVVTSRFSKFDHHGGRL